MTNKITSLDNWDQLNKLKEIDFNSGKFEANGTTYFLESKLSTARFIEFQVLQHDFSRGMTVTEFYKWLADCKSLLNQTKFFETAVFINKLQEHCLKLKDKEPVVYKICSLFCNTENEDRTTWGNDLVVKKMEDWKKSDINSACFFHIALTLLPGYIEAYNDLTQSISQGMEIVPEIVNASIK